MWQAADLFSSESDSVRPRFVSFIGATLKNVSFHAAWTWHSWSKKYYRAIKTIRFDDAKMDKLTYAALKGMDADLSKVTVI